MIKKLLLFIALSVIANITFANTTQWHIIPSKSSIVFSATQNGAPIKGQFKHFTGTIEFDPNDLKNSHVKMIIDMNSLTVGYKEVADTLRMPDWFNIKKFPEAVFKADQFVKINKQTYQAKGELTIRDKTIPTTVDFTITQYSSSEAHAQGGAILKRTQFGIGQGEWANTDSIKDDVNVQFVMVTKK